MNVIVVGAGTMGRTHLEAYAGMEDVRILGLVDSDPIKAGELADRHGIRLFTTWEEAAEVMGDAELVDICLPTYLHKEYVKKAAALGKHVICEKPLAGSLKDAREMIEYCKEQGVRLFVGHVVRFFPEYAMAKQTIESGAIGSPAVVKASRTSSFPRAWQNWYADGAKSGGVLMDLSIHDFDFLRWCFGDVERVYAKCVPVPGAGEYALTTLTFQNGVIAQVEGSWAHQRFTTAYEIAGTSGILDYNSAKDTPLVSFTRSDSASVAGVAVPESPLLETPYAKELHHFISCIKEEREPLVSAEDAYEALAISLAAIESSRTGEPVQIGNSPAAAIV